MSGHSKWSTIKRQKGVADAKRGQVFTKLGSAITIAVREGGGGDPASNFRLRLAMEQARGVNMPNINIQRAVDRGLGPSTSSGLGQLESVVYEGYGPSKVAIIVEAATDNKNRTTPEVRGVIERGGGTFATPGAVSWMFADAGLITVAKNGTFFEEIFEAAVDCGAEDVEDAGDLVEIYTKPADVEKVKNAMASRGLTPKSTEIFKKPTTVQPIDDAEVAKKVLGLIEKLEDLDDVQKVYANFDIPDNLLK
ncbi:MAG: transcriptional regulator [Candidatus Curtissbacteria bacterium GW2011_GWA1_40_9]|uniref:Probable transcriptional regulatory protein UU23_C0001G0012 n=1 Tax=Candidatus Curtissbacteria bacterium GW2011_GWA1_40_9 TaxID=1618408 RepID=A0A0G0TMP3_9BACT|nr:MAG: transcriptional regulator [Candidatus Curtissbacteria bacterium GW2011_GWA1_40_9]